MVELTLNTEQNIRIEIEVIEGRLKLRIEPEESQKLPEQKTDSEVSSECDDSATSEPVDTKIVTDIKTATPQSKLEVPIKTLFKESSNANQLLEKFLNYLELDRRISDFIIFKSFVERFKNLIKKYHSSSYAPTWLELHEKSTFTLSDINDFHEACQDKGWGNNTLEVIGILSKYYYKYQKEFETPVNDHLFEIKPGADIDKINSLEESLRSLCKDDEIGDQVIAAITKIGFLEDELSIKAYNYAIAFFKNGETKPGRFYDKARVFWSEVGTRIRRLVYHYPEGEAIISSVGFFTTIKKFISN